MSDARRASLEAAASRVAREYSTELIAAAGILATAARTESEFNRIWAGIGALARSSIFDHAAIDTNIAAPVRPSSLHDTLGRADD